MVKALIQSIAMVALAMVLGFQISGGRVPAQTQPVCPAGDAACVQASGAR